MDRHLTQVYENERQIAKTRPGMAFWAGSRPAGAKCDKCGHWQIDASKRNAKPRCEQYRRMTGTVGSPIPIGTPACKYFRKVEKARGR